MGPLTGIKVVELAGIGPGPYAGQLLADMGAEVINVERPGTGSIPGAGMPSVDKRGKKSIVVDLRTPEGAQIVLDLVKTADVLFEGLRPGVTERLGVGPEDCHAVNPKLVYGRMTGWGQTGPWAKVAGHDINYISITGALEAMGDKDVPPPPPLNLVGDFGGGSLFLVNGILAALLQAERTGKGEIIDAAIIDGVSSMMGMMYSLSGNRQWRPKRQSNLLDGAMPFYRCYRTQDDRFMAIGCIEPQFFKAMMDLLELDMAEFGNQYDPSQHTAQHTKLETVFATKPRDEWAEIFDGSDACVSPVLDLIEAAEHKQNIARGGLKNHDGFIHPRTAPVFGDDQNTIGETASAGAHTAEVLSGFGYAADEIEALTSKGIIKT